MFEGRDITRLPPEAICHAGIARTFQLNACFESLSLRDNVRVAAYFGRDKRRYPGLSVGKEADEHAGEALATVGLTGKDDVPAGALPVLDRKLLMLAGALATRPRLLLMDEPVGGLNPRETDHFMDVVRRIVQSGVTIILIEHVMRFLVQLSSRVIIMHHGERIYEGPPRGLTSDRTVIDVYLGEGASQRLGRLMEGGTG
jgi:branched-chain amino acid transport system ATP-binding protein